MVITGIEQDAEAAEIKAQLLGSFLTFTKTFFKLKTGREFFLSTPVGRESHYITIAKMLTDVFYLRTRRLIIRVPPGHAKSTMLTYFFAWCFAHYPDCNFIYISYGADLAASHTASVKSIMEMPIYRELFGVQISSDSSAKDDFKTLQGGRVTAFGSMGGITGIDAGLPNLERFSGGVFLDDMHKPSEVFSDNLRRGVIDNYNMTIKPRPRGHNVPIVMVGHALHEDDLGNFLVTGQDGYKWEHLKLAAIDDAGNILAPNLTSREMLEAEREFNPYVFYSQYQQEPQPAGGGIFKTEWFDLLDFYPKMFCTFLTVDTAESTKDHADQTVFSFWGLYEITYKERKTGEYGLHWIDCKTMRIEPSDLEDALIEFYSRCLDFMTPPKFVAIEKKSSGTTLISTLKKMRGIDVRDIERTKASGSKVARYFEIQPFVAKRLISLPKYAPHTSECLDHMRKITANNTHHHDDIADTMYDAIKIALINKTVQHTMPAQKDKVMAHFMDNFNKINKMRAQ